MLLLIFFFQVSFRTYTAAFLRDRQVYHRKMRFLQLGLSLSLLFFFFSSPVAQALWVSCKYGAFCVCVGWWKIEKALFLFFIFFPLMFVCVFFFFTIIVLSFCLSIYFFFYKLSIEEKQQKSITYQLSSAWFWRDAIMTPWTFFSFLLSFCFFFWFSSTWLSTAFVLFSAPRKNTCHEEVCCVGCWRQALVVPFKISVISFKKKKKMSSWVCSPPSFLSLSLSLSLQPTLLSRVQTP